MCICARTREIAKTFAHRVEYECFCCGKRGEVGIDVKDEEIVWQLVDAGVWGQATKQ